MDRKIVQVAFATDGGETETNWYMYVLTEDGKLWTEKKWDKGEVTLQEVTVHFEEPKIK